MEITMKEKTQTIKKKLTQEQKDKLKKLAAQ